jgi:hypothetical protein
MIESQLLLRCMMLVGAHLLLLWSLSPLGGQASLRALEKTRCATLDRAQLCYVHMGDGNSALARFYKYDGTSTDTIYTSALNVPKSMKLAPLDVWGNVRVLRLEALNALSAAPTTTGPLDEWLPVPPITWPEQYLSLLGISVVGLPPDREANFTIEVSYMSITVCAPWQVFPPYYNAWVKHLGRVWAFAKHYRDPSY